MGGRHKRPHAITATDELLGHVLDELEGLRDDIVPLLRRVFPEPPGPADDEQDKPATGDSATVRIQEPETTTPPPAKKAAPRKPAPAKKTA